MDWFKRKENVRYVQNKIYILLYMRSSSILILVFIAFGLVTMYLYNNVFD